MTAFKPPQNRVGARDHGQDHDACRVAGFEWRPLQQITERSRPDVERQRHPHQNDRHDRDQRKHHAAALVVPPPQILRQRVDAHAPIERQENEAEHHQPGDRAVLEMRLREADRVSQAQHADQVFGADVRSENRSRDAPPRNTPAGKEITFGVFLAATGPQTNPHDQRDGGQEDDDVKRGQRNRHRELSAAWVHLQGAEELENRAPAINPRLAARPSG